MVNKKCLWPEPAKVVLTRKAHGEWTQKHHQGFGIGGDWSLDATNGSIMWIG